MSNLMLMDGEAILVGDFVFDMQHGGGAVTALHVPDGLLMVRFSSIPITFKYKENGVRDGASNRTLFWRNPVVIAPTKSETVWGELSLLIPTIRDVLLRLK